MDYKNESFLILCANINEELLAGIHPSLNLVLIISTETNNESDLVAAEEMEKRRKELLPKEMEWKDTRFLIHGRDLILL